jgi:hypothetical protein
MRHPHGSLRQIPPYEAVRPSRYLRPWLTTFSRSPLTGRIVRRGCNLREILDRIRYTVVLCRGGRHDPKGPTTLPILTGSRATSCSRPSSAGGRAGPRDLVSTPAADPAAPAR